MSAETKEAAKEEGIRLLKVRGAALVLIPTLTLIHTHTLCLRRRWCSAPWLLPC